MLWAERLGPSAQPAVLLLTGAAMQATTWETAFLDPLLETGRSVIRFDWRDIGLSSWKRFRDQPYTIDDLATDCVAVLDDFGVEAADVIGYSMGGCVAQLVALSAPQRVRTLTLVSSGYASRIDVDRSERDRRLRELIAEPRPADSEQHVQRLVQQWRLLCGWSYSFDERRWRERAQSWVDRGQNPSCPHIRLGPQVFGVDRRDQLAQLTVRTLIIHGDDDPMFPLAHAEELARTIPDARIVVLAGRGHELYVDAEVARRVAHHLE